MFDALNDEEYKNIDIKNSLLKTDEAHETNIELKIDDKIKANKEGSMLGQTGIKMSEENKYAQSALINEVLLENKSELESGIKYIDTEHNLEILNISNQGIDEERGYSSLVELGQQIKDMSLFDKYKNEVEKIGEDFARYKWAYDEGKFGEFDRKKFTKEVLKAGMRSLGASSLSMAGNMLKILGTNIKENTGLGMAVTLGSSLVAPEAGNYMVELGDLLGKYANDIENLDFLSPSDEFYNENPSWISLANLIGQSSGVVLAMGGSSKLIGSKATYGLFAVGGSGDVFDESIEKEGNVDKANMLAIANAGSNYAIDRWFNPLPEHLEKGVKISASKIAKEMFGAPLREAGSEAMQQIMAENLVRKVGIDDTQLLFEGLIESAIGGMAGSFVVGGTSGTAYLADKAYKDIEKRIMLKGVSKEEIELYKTSMLEFIKSKPEAFDKILRYNLTQNMKEIVKNIDDRKKRKLVKKDFESMPKIYDEVYNKMLKVAENEAEAKAMARMFQAGALFFQQIGEDVNYLKDAYSPDKIDMLQIEDYDWVIFNSTYQNNQFDRYTSLYYNVKSMFSEVL